MAGARFARPNHIYKNLPRLYYPLLETHPRTPHFPSSFPPERFLRPHPRLLLCFKFFLPSHCPLSGGLGPNHIYKNLPRSYYPLVKTHQRTPHFPSSFPPERFLRPPGSSSALSSFSLYNRPLSGGLGQVFVYVAGARFARPNHIYKNLPRSYYPLLKTHQRTPHFPSSFPPERFLRPPGSSSALNSFFLYNRPLSGGLGQVFVYVAGARFARPNHIYKNLPRLYYPLLKTHPRTPHIPSSFPPERFLRPTPGSSFALNSFSLYTAPSPEAWAPTTYTKTCPAYTTPVLKPTHGRRTFPQASLRNAF